MADGSGKSESGGMRVPPMEDGGGHRCTATLIDENTRLTKEFLETTPGKEFEKYRGEWIAVASGNVVAHGKDPNQVHAEGRNAGRGSPLMEYIYARPEDVPWFYIPPKA